MQLLLNKYWTLFSEKPPKGFGKFFGEKTSKPPNVENESSSKSESEPSDVSQDAKETKKFEKNYEFKWGFGGGKGSDGKKSSGKENSDREKWFTFGMIGSTLLFAVISYYGYAYQEITWNDLKK